MFEESFIKDTRKDSHLLKVLRIIAILGTIAVALQSSFSVFILKPRQEYSYYVLTVILFTVILLCSILYKSTVKLFRNLDILVPLGLYLFVDKLIGFLIFYPAGFSFLNENGFDFSYLFQNVSLLSVITLVWVLQIILGVVFVGWTTSAILQLRSRKKVDLLEALYEFKKWFFKVFLVLAIFKYIPIILMIPLIWSGITQSTILGFISASVIFSIVYNLATYAVVLFVLAEKDSLINSINKGVRGSLENISKVAVPIVLQLLILGFVYLVSVNYTVEKIENIDGTEESVNSGFGSEENKTITISNTTNTTTDEISHVSYGANTFWVGSYNETTKWHEQTLSAVKAEPLKSVDFKLKILLLLLSIVMQIEVVRKIFGESNNRKFINIGDRLFESSNFEQTLEKERLKITPIEFVLIVSLLIYFLPFERAFTKNTTSETVIENKSTSTVMEKNISKDFPEFDYPKVLLGEDFFEKKEIFLNPRFVDGKRLLEDSASFVDVPEQLKTNETREEKEKIERKIESNREKYRRIIDVTAGSFDKESGEELLVAGDKRAFIIDENGIVKKQIDYKLGSYNSDGVKQEYNFPFIKLIDIDDDGKPEILGHGVNICQIIDLDGNVIWKFKGKGKGNDIDVDLLTAGDINNDGKKEILVYHDGVLEAFNKTGRRLWKNQYFDYSIHSLNIGDFDNDGKNEVLLEQILINGEGQIIKKLKTPYRNEGIHRKDNKNTNILFFNNQKVGLFSAGKLIEGPYIAPHSELRIEKENDDFDLLNGVVYSDSITVNFDKKNYLVILAKAFMNVSYDSIYFLYIYDAERKLVYYETIHADDSHIAVVERKDGTNSLLVSDDGKLNIYTIKK